MGLPCLKRQPLHLKNRALVKLKLFIAMITTLVLLIGLSACSGLSLGTASKLQRLDVLKEDVAQMTFVLDAPLSILPQDDGIVFKFDATTSQYGERNIHAVLERGGDFDAVQILDPPGNNRTYHLFALTNEDQEKFREFQSWANELKRIQGSAGGTLTMDFTVSFCRVSQTGASQVNGRDERITIYVSLPGEIKFEPLISNVKLSELVGNSSADLPICVQT